MKHYFSGIASEEEASMLKEAGVARVLVDPTDIPNIDWDSYSDVALDSGAYRAFRSGGRIKINEWIKVAIAHPFTFVVAPDVIGDPIATMENWKEVRHHQDDLPLVPVWHWGSEIEVLEQLLDQASTVGIGACVPWMRVDNSRKRDKQDIADDEQRRMANFLQLKEICQKHGDRLHLFGLCWVKAMEELAPYLGSADSSHWLVGARKGAVIFENTRTKHLSQAPARCLPFARDWDRRQRCVENARAIAQFLGEPLQPTVPSGEPQLQTVWA